MPASREPDEEARSGGAVVPAAERRRHPRVTAPWPAIVQDTEGRTLPGEVIDVSLSGLKLRVGPEVAVGDAVRLRLTLPHGGGDIEVAAQVVRRDPEGVGVDFGTLSPSQSERLRTVVPTWDMRRRAERVEIDLPIRIEGHGAATEGRTIDLSAFGGRIVTREPLTPGDLVTALLVPRDGLGPMSLRAVVWDVDAHGAVLVFANLPAADFVRVRSYVDSLLARRS
ncbi:MAG TPA: PilZ domain-containing protein [Candidatus Bathyarchaeia archaeon]|nr:PilZ domain-containing protein [Candidatus Bathyarchaeia archaeon]